MEEVRDVAYLHALAEGGTGMCREAEQLLPQCFGVPVCLRVTKLGPPSAAGYLHTRPAHSAHAMMGLLLSLLSNQ